MPKVAFWTSKTVPEVIGRFPCLTVLQQLRNVKLGNKDTYYSNIKCGI